MGIYFTILYYDQCPSLIKKFTPFQMVALFFEDNDSVASSLSSHTTPHGDNNNRRPPLYALTTRTPPRRMICYTGSQILHVPDYQRPDIRVFVIDVNIINVNVVRRRMHWVFRMYVIDGIRREGK